VSERRRILVVDDQEDIREMARLVLTGAGYEVATASSGREALRLARQKAFDLMLLDINMPDLDGWATLRLLRADDSLDDLKVAMFSVKSEVRDKVAGLKDGAIDYLTKPFSVDELVTRVSRILAEANGAPAVPTASPR
jgi:DNA-binding response OmpR family regulator